MCMLTPRSHFHMTYYCRDCVIYDRIQLSGTRRVEHVDEAYSDSALDNGRGIPCPLDPFRL